MKNIISTIIAVVILSSCGLSKRTTSVYMAPPKVDTISQTKGFISSYVNSDGIKVLKIGGSEYFSAGAFKNKHK